MPWFKMFLTLQEPVALHEFCNTTCSPARCSGISLLDWTSSIASEISWQLLMVWLIYCFDNQGHSVWSGLLYWTGIHYSAVWGFFRGSRWHSETLTASARLTSALSNRFRKNITGFSDTKPATRQYRRINLWTSIGRWAAVINRC